MARPLFFALLALVAGCRRAEAISTRPEPAPVAVTPTSASVAAQDAAAAAPHDASSAAVAPPDAGPATVDRVTVARDSDAWRVRGEDAGRTRVLFLPGLCSNAYAYLLTFPEAARAHGGVLAIDGDKPCGAASSGFRSFTWDPSLQRARLEAALAASGQAVPEEGFTLVGYSAGASIAQMMHAKWPQLFPRIVLIAPPEDPDVARLRSARRVVMMSCAYDVPGRMKTAASRLAAKGVAARYLEMPGCTHGNIADGERLFGDAFGWLDES